MDVYLLVGLGFNFVGLIVLTLAVFRRAPAVAPVDHHGLRLARASLAYAKQTYPTAEGDDLLRHALVVFRELDLSEDNKRDFSDRQAGIYLRAAL